MKLALKIAALPLLFAAPIAAQETQEFVTPTSVVASASADEWVAIPAEDLLVMELAPDAAGNPRTVVIQLIPAPFSQPWVENIRTLAAAHWWDGTSVNRVQDNYVTQWGDVTEEKPLPERVVVSNRGYTATRVHRLLDAQGGPRFTRDPWSERSQFFNGWPVASDGMRMVAWPIHCYSYVGVGRGYAPDTGSGAELYTIIGQPQRHMDRNLAVVGRVIEGMQHLSSLPRGSGELGFYTEDEAHLRVPIASVRLASELEEAPSFEYLDTSSASFARYVAIRANRNDSFYTVPAGGVDICSVEVPVRRAGE